MSGDDVSALTAKLDTLIRLVALGLCDEKPQRDKIALLAAAGLQPKAIAEMIGTTANTVSVTLSSIRRTSRGNRSD
jgi:DNA-binding NarL/FixJ family response regulator